VWAVLWLGPASVARAQQPVTVTLQASAASVEVGQAIRVDVEIASRGLTIESVSDLPAPGFTVVGTSRQQAVQFSLGMGRSVETLQLTLSYTLRAVTPGNWTIGPVAASTGGRSFSSGSVQVSVRPNAGGGSVPPGIASGTGGAIPAPVAPPETPEMPLSACRAQDGSAFDPERTDGPVFCGRTEKDLFVELWVSDVDVFLGEPLRLQVRAYVRQDIVGFNAGAVFSQLLRREPGLEGFLRTNLEGSERTLETRRAGGRQYLYATLRDKLLYPTRSGQLEIGPAEAVLTLRGMFDTEELRRGSVRLPIRVRPLPAEGRPRGFSPNNVGRELTLQASATPTSVLAGRPVELTLELAGEGNLGAFRIDPPELAGAQVVRSTDRVEDPDSATTTGRRRLTYVVTPGRAGTLDLSTFEIPYFDYGRRAYRVLRPTALRVSVTGPPEGEGDGEAEDGDSATAAQAGPRVSVRPFNDLGEVTVPLHRSAWFWVLLAFPPFSLAAFQAGLALRRFRARRRGVVRPADVLRRGRSTLRRIARGRGGGDAGAQYGAVEDALLEYLEARLGEPLRGLTVGDLQRRLVRAGVPEPLAESVGVQLEGCAFGRFAPSESRLQGAAEAAQGMLAALSGIERVRLDPGGGDR
jgi:hypothetical protein